MTYDRSIRVAVVGGARTPFARAGTVFRKYSALDLGVHAVDGLLAKQSLDPQSGRGTGVRDYRRRRADPPPREGHCLLQRSTLRCPGTHPHEQLHHGDVGDYGDRRFNRCRPRAENRDRGWGRVDVQPGAAVRQTGESHLPRRRSGQNIRAASPSLCTTAPRGFQASRSGRPRAVHRLVDGRAHGAHGQGVEDPT